MGNSNYSYLLHGKQNLAALEYYIFSSPSDSSHSVGTNHGDSALPPLLLPRRAHLPLARDARGVQTHTPGRSLRRHRVGPGQVPACVA